MMHLVRTDAELYQRGMRTLIASWAACAHGSDGAAVHQHPGVSVAVFPAGPERAIYNNAVLDRDLAPAERAAALDAMQTAYSAAGVTSFAAWTQESDLPMRSDLERRGFWLQESTRAMGMAVADVRLPRPSLDLAPPDWPAYLRILGVPPGLLGGVDRRRFHLLIAGLAGQSVAAAMAFDSAGDCGIYNVSTLEPARRRGLGTALTAMHVYDALDRGCDTASLQSTPAGERIYAAIGFRDLGLILEYAPPAVP
jgi:ribosomal protein S18 acetylase RimI-like enzyme